MNFLIGAWEGPRRFVMNTPEESKARYREMLECGINTLFLFAELADSEWLKLSLDAAEDVGLNLIVDLGASWRDREKLGNAVKNTVDHPSVIAYNVVDEPPIGWLDDVGSAVEYIKNICGGKPVFSNLNPLYAPPTYLAEERDGITPYQGYIAEVEKKVKPDMLSFDYYPYVGDENANTCMKTAMLRNLTDIRIAANRMNIPICGFLQSSRWGRYVDGEWHGTVIPNPNQYRFLFNVHLVFGVSMLTDFLYWSRTGTRPEQRMPGIFDGIMTEGGEKTEIFRYVKRINSELSEIGEKLLKYEFAGLIADGLNSEKYDAVKELLLNGFHGESFETDGQILAGCFENRDTYAVLYVNMSDSESAELTLNGEKHILPAGGSLFSEGKYKT